MKGLRVLIKDVNKAVELFLAQASLKKNTRYSGALKAARCAQRMTLEEATAGICSASYLSKLENNLLVPDQAILNKLLEKFALVDALATTGDRLERPEVVITKFLIGDDEYFQEKMRVISEAIVPDWDVYRLYHALLADNEQAFRSGMKRLNEVIASLGYEAFALLIVACATYYEQCGQWPRARHYWEQLEQLAGDDEWLRNLAFIGRLVASYYIGDKAAQIGLVATLAGLPRFYYPEVLLARLDCINLLLKESRDTEQRFRLLLEKYAEVPRVRQVIFDFYCQWLMREARLATLINFLTAQNVWNRKTICYLGIALAQFSTDERNRPEFTDWLKLYREIYSRLTLKRWHKQEIAVLRLIRLILNNATPAELYSYLAGGIIKELENHYHPVFLPYYIRLYHDLLAQVSRYKEWFVFSQHHPEAVKYLRK